VSRTFSHCRQQQHTAVSPARLPTTIGSSWAFQKRKKGVERKGEASWSGAQSTSLRPFHNIDHTARRRRRDRWVLPIRRPDRGKKGGKGGGGGLREKDHPGCPSGRLFQGRFWRNCPRRAIPADGSAMRRGKRKKGEERGERMESRKSTAQGTHLNFHVRLFDRKSAGRLDLSFSSFF